MIIYLAWNTEPDDNRCFWFNMDEEASDETYLRGSLFDGIWSGYERSKVRIVPRPAWADRTEW